MFCPQCGTETQPVAKFCHACRHPLNIASAATIAPKTLPLAKQTAPTATLPPALSDSRPHPWRRLFARTTDMALVAPLLYLLLFNNFGKGSPFIEFLIGTDGALWLLDRPFLIVVLIYVLWAPIEAAFLTWFGTTIGKLALGIRVIDAEGSRLSYGAAFKRSIWVLSIGVAFGIPFVIWLSGLIAYRRLDKRGKTFWDEHWRFLQNSKSADIWPSHPPSRSGFLTEGVSGGGFC